MPAEPQSSGILKVGVVEVEVEEVEVEVIVHGILLQT